MPEFGGQRDLRQKPHSTAACLQNNNNNNKTSSLLISLSLQPSLPPRPQPPLFLIYPRTEVHACLAHDIDFHQHLEISSEPLPGQPASTFSHFCISPRILFFTSSMSVFLHGVGHGLQSDRKTNALRWRGVIGGE